MENSTYVVAINAQADKVKGGNWYPLYVRYAEEYSDDVTLCSHIAHAKHFENLHYAENLIADAETREHLHNMGMDLATLKVQKVSFTVEDVA